MGRCRDRSMVRLNALVAMAIGLAFLPHVSCDDTLAYNAVTTWLTQQGAQFNAMRVVNEQSTRGVVIAERVQDGHAMMRIPLTAVISAAKTLEEQPAIRAAVSF